VNVIFLHAIMNKSLRSLAICALALTGGFGWGQKQAPHEKQIFVTIGDEPVTFNGAQPKTIMGRIMVPVRGVFEKIGAYVEYDAATHVITAHYNNESIEIKMGNKIANVNGAEILMEVPATIINGNALVPLRFLAESMGAKVDYDFPTNTVKITPSATSFGGAGSTGGSM